MISLSASSSITTIRSEEILIWRTLLRFFDLEAPDVLPESINVLLLPAISALEFSGLLYDRAGYHLAGRLIVRLPIIGSKHA